MHLIHWLTIFAAVAQIVFCYYVARKNDLLKYAKIGPKQKTPMLYRAVAVCTMVVFIAGLVLCLARFGGIADNSGWEPFVYMFLCLCCLSIFLVNKIALLEWRKTVCAAEAKEGEKKQ